MTSTLPSISEHLLRTATEHSLRAFLEPNAIFLAELLHTTYPSHVSANLLATAHLRQGNYSQAAQTLKPATTSENRYLYAVCLFRIGTPESLRDAEANLRGRHGPIDVELPSSTSESTPGASAGLYLLGNICKQTGRKDEAISLYRRALKSNPTLWVAFEALAKMGIVYKADDFLPNQSDATALECLRAQPQFNAQIPKLATPCPIKQQAHTTKDVRNPGKPVANPQHCTPRESEAYATPSPMVGRVHGRQFGDMATPAAPQQAPRNLGRRGPRPSSSPSTSTTGLRIGRRGRSVGLEDSSIRNPTDLFAPTPDKHGLPQRKQPSVSPMRVTAPENGAPDKMKESGASEHMVLDGDTSDTIDLIRSLGQIVAELGQFRCTRTIELSNNLSEEHRNSGVVLSWRGRAFLEKGEYEAAEKEFKKALEKQPMRMDGVVEYYSSVLWHLKKERELAQLAIRAQLVHPVSSSAWCAAGNCFSLQHDPDSALKFFRRAIVTSKVPNAYAYTLCGHEHVVQEDFEAALAVYREALHIDERHYNAMYGIGQVLLKQEKFGLAQNHFRCAVLINPLNSTLHYHLGVSLAAGVNAVSGADAALEEGKHALILALAELETAANLDLRNPVPRFERAKILIAMNRLSDARKQLEDLRDLLPKEAEVHYELGKVYQRFGKYQDSLLSFTFALDLEPKERKYKKALDALVSEVEANGHNRS